MKNQTEKRRERQREIQKKDFCQTITSVRRCKTWIRRDKSTGLKKLDKSNVDTKVELNVYHFC